MMKATPIRERFLEDRNLFALRYKEGLVFLEVEEYEDTEFDRFTQLGDIESDTSLDSGYQNLNDSSGDDILKVPGDASSKTVIHTALGIAPTQIEVDIAYPDGTRTRGSIPNLSGNPTSGGQVGGIDGSQSPYNEPTEKTELIIPPKQEVEFNFHNLDTEDSHEPILYIPIRKYRVNVLNINNGMDRGAIKNILRPGSPAPIKSVGNYLQKNEFNLQNEWGVRPVRREDAMRRVRQ